MEMGRERASNGQFQKADYIGNLTAKGSANVWDARPKRRLKSADAFDGRTTRARRFKALVADFEVGFGSTPGPRENALIRQAAAVAVEAEGLQAAIVRGETIDIDVLVRVTNVLARALAALGLKRGTGRQDTTPTLADIIARHQQEEAAQ
jgi:hypothetical protein